MKETTGTIYRMVTPKNLCPWGIKALDLLKRNGFEVEDHHLETEEANEAYKEKHGCDETPQVHIGDDRLNYDGLRERPGKGPDTKTGNAPLSRTPPPRWRSFQTSRSQRKNGIRSSDSMVVVGLD